MNNPFSEPFAAVETKVREQQAAEVDLIKLALHNMAAITKGLPEHKVDMQ